MESPIDLRNQLNEQLNEVTSLKTQLFSKESEKLHELQLNDDQHYNKLRILKKQMEAEKTTLRTNLLGAQQTLHAQKQKNLNSS